MTTTPENSRNSTNPTIPSEERNDEVIHENAPHSLDLVQKSVGKPEMELNKPLVLMPEEEDETLENAPPDDAPDESVLSFAELNVVNQGTVQELPDDGYSASWADVNSVERNLGLSGDLFSSLEYRQDRLGKQDIPSYSGFVPQRINYFPFAPDIDFFQPESLLRTSSFATTSATLEGNIFDQGASAGQDGLGSIDVNGDGQGYQKSFIAGGIIITTPDGNTLTLYTQDQPALNIRMGDYVYTLNNPMMHTSGALEVMDMIHPDTGELIQVFIENFTYTIADSNGDIVTGKIVPHIIDDAPSAIDLAPAPIDEADITITDSLPGGTNQSPVSAEISGSLIDFVHNYFGADGGLVTRVTIVGGTSVTANGFITVTTREGNVLVVNQATGEYTYTLSNPIDNKNHQNATDDEALDVFEFEFTDGDHDVVVANLTITVIDDVPVAKDIDAGSINESSHADGTSPNSAALTQTGTLLNGAENQFGADGGEVTMVEIDGGTTDYSDPNIITVTTADNNILTVDRFTGAYIYTLIHPITHSNGNDALEVFRYEFTDNDGDKANAELTVTVVDDAPVASSVQIPDLYETNLPGGTNPDAAELVRTGVIIDGINNKFGADGGIVSSVTIAGQTSNTLSNGMITVVTAEGNRLEVYQATGAYTYYLMAPVSHDPNQNTATDTFTFTLTDSDGSTASANLVVNINDDAPTATDIPMGTVYESHLTTGSDAGAGALILSGKLFDHVNFGADGGSIIGISVISGNGGTSADQGNLIVVTTAEGNVLTVDRISGAYTYTLNAPVQHATAAGNNQYNEIFRILVADNDGDEADAEFSVIIVDDVPEANPFIGGTFDQANLPNGSEPSGTVLQQSGSLFTGHPDNEIGADDAVVDSITYRGTEYTAINGTITVTTAEGNVLTVNANTGSYTYTFTNPVDHATRPPSEINEDGFAIDRFTYKLRDADGDTASADLTILIEPDVIPPVANPDTFEFGATLGAINLVLALDYSGSMAGTPISALKAFLADPGGLIDTYASLSSEITITVILFSDRIRAELTSNDIDEAKDLIQTTAAGGGTNFNLPMHAAYTALSNAPDDAQNIFYFVSDGQAGSPSNQFYTTQWYPLLDDKDIDSVVVSIGQNTNIQTLALIANPDDDPKVRTTDGALTDIEDVLLTDTQQITGNIINDAGNGADDPGNGGPLEVSAFSQIINGVEVNGTFGVPFQTEHGGFLTLQANGSFVYEASLALLRNSYTETFSYTITNSSGSDTSTFTIEITGAAPVVIDMNGDGVVDVSSISEGIMYDIDGDGTNEQTSWVGPNDGILVFDFQGDGKVTDAKEFVFTMWDETAQTDMEALRNVFDTNGDGVLNAQDEGWAQFGIWQDKNGNGLSDEGEFFSLDELGFEQLDLFTDEEMQHLNASASHGVSQLHHKDGYSIDAHDVSLKYVDIIVEEPLFPDESAPQGNSSHSSSSDLPPLANDSDFSAPSPEANLAYEMEMQQQNTESLG